MAQIRKSRKVLVTGGTGSVGRALIAAFIENGDQVTFQYCHGSEHAERIRIELGAIPVQLDFGVDFALPDSDYDVVINNAGINISDVNTLDVSTSVWDRTIRINLTAPFLVIRQCLPAMISRAWGRIINVSSIYGLRAVEGNCPYTASKHGLSGLTKTVAKEYAQSGITCNEICPGPIDSAMMAAIAERTSTGTATDYLKEVSEAIPAKRMAEPREVADLAVFLASSEAGYLTGASIPIDGGIIA